jgi:hypothetical protein
LYAYMCVRCRGLRLAIINHIKFLIVMHNVGKPHKHPWLKVPETEMVMK